MPSWRWEPGKVDRSEEHFELRHGDARAGGGWRDWLPVALIGPARGGAFQVEFLIDETTEAHRVALEELRRELTFYLVDLDRPDPWGYARHHCDTMANVYSKIHWSFHPC